MADAKHLELLQTNIQRLAGNGFVIKGWGVTLLTVILGTTLKESRASYALFGIAPILLFWFLDGYFLALERGYRRKFDAAAELVRRDHPPTFDMSAPPFFLMPVLLAMFSPASWIVFVPALLVMIMAAVIV